jgi:hypothetical protein
MDDEYAKLLRDWLRADPAVPVQARAMDAAWEACVRQPEAVAEAVIPAPRVSAENRNRSR